MHVLGRAVGGVGEGGRAIRRSACDPGLLRCCCVVVAGTAQAFDCTRKTTYQNLTEWYKELRIYCESIPVIVVANKIDVDYNVSTRPRRSAPSRRLLR